MDCESLNKALRFLATAYVEAKSGRCPIANIDESLQRETGFRYEPHQSDKTMKQFSNEYQTDWQGKKVWLEGHIKKGSSREARFAIRVGFHYDEELEVVVVGYIGQHQTTRKS